MCEEHNITMKSRATTNEFLRDKKDGGNGRLGSAKWRWKGGGDK